MRIRLLLAVLAVAALAVPGGAWAAKPQTQKQYTEQQLKTQMNKRFKPLGVTITKVTCVLPKNGTTVKCVTVGSAPKARESFVFKVSESLSATGVMSWRITSSACSDSQTHQKLSCSG